ncbi:hypothetical protein GMD78_17495 [Ornithinibacillus sp. L9]|uniref:YolD-like protein n=1 Tax=Ornithinibacillus caprae TaxID=2678566 RepID=A0A6N8FKJ2_9BACI|nr:hypothetical protein [Ornithinibacillus caprae]MUK90170.1 hypothetical protein [Ornithinibacillus caprae]
MENKKLNNQSRLISLLLTAEKYQQNLDITVLKRELSLSYTGRVQHYDRDSEQIQFIDFENNTIHYFDIDMIDAAICI